MADPITVAAIRTKARLYADQRTAGFMTDDEVDLLINEEGKRLYDQLVLALDEDYFETFNDISIVAGTSSYSLPADFYQSLGLVLLWSSINASDRDELVKPAGGRMYVDVDNQGVAWVAGSPKSYRIAGTKLYVSPKPDVAVTGRLRYIPIQGTLTDGGGGGGGS